MQRKLPKDFTQWHYGGGKIQTLQQSKFNSNALKHHYATMQEMDSKEY